MPSVGDLVSEAYTKLVMRGISKSLRLMTALSLDCACGSRRCPRLRRGLVSLLAGAGREITAAELDLSGQQHTNS